MRLLLVLVLVVCVANAQFIVSILPKSPGGEAVEVLTIPVDTISRACGALARLVSRANDAHHFTCPGAVTADAVTTAILEDVYQNRVSRDQFESQILVNVVPDVSVELSQSDPIQSQAWQLDALNQELPPLDGNVQRLALNTTQRVLVCIIDSATHWNNPEIETPLTGRFVEYFDIQTQSSTIRTTGVPHGHQVATMAVGNNLGVSPQSLHARCGIWGDERGGPISEVFACMTQCRQWATRRNLIPIINLSLGRMDGIIDTGYFSESNLIQRLGGIVFQSSGNEGVNAQFQSFDIFDTVKHYVIGSVSRNLTRSLFSTYGTQLFAVAPGERVLSVSGPGNVAPYASILGTSFSSPYVAGYAALLMDAAPSAVQDRVALRNLIVDHIKVNASRFPSASVRNDEYGFGRPYLNANRLPPYHQLIPLPPSCTWQLSRAVSMCIWPPNNKMIEVKQAAALVSTFATGCPGNATVFLPRQNCTEVDPTTLSPLPTPMGACIVVNGSLFVLASKADRAQPRVYKIDASILNRNRNVPDNVTFIVTVPQSVSNASLQGCTSLSEPRQFRLLVNATLTDTINAASTGIQNDVSLLDKRAFSALTRAEIERLLRRQSSLNHSTLDDWVIPVVSVLGSLLGIALIVIVIILFYRPSSTTIYSSMF